MCRAEDGKNPASLLTGNIGSRRKGFRAVRRGRKLPVSENITAIGNLELIPDGMEMAEEEREEGKYIKIGSMEFKYLPPGWEMEKRVTEEGIVQYILMDVHTECHMEYRNAERGNVRAGNGESGSASVEIVRHREGYKHEIVITPYKIRKMPKLSLQLAAETEEYFQVPMLYGIKGKGKTEEVRGCWMYAENRETEQMEYFIFSRNAEGEKELFHVTEGDISITAMENEVEAFWGFMDKGLVWVEGGKYRAERYSGNNNSIEYYYLLNRNTQTPLLAVMQQTPDEIAVYRRGCYETPVSMQEMEGLSVYMLGVADINQDGYEDFLCKYWLLNTPGSHNAEKEEYEGYLWNEQSNAFVYVPGKEMLERYGNIWESWKSPPESLPGEEIVPEGLAGYLAGCLTECGEEMSEVMAPLATGREFTMEEVKQLADENAVIEKELLRIACAVDGSGVWLKVDADNDGKEDIFLREYLGGSLHIVYYYLFTQTAVGDYVIADSQWELQEPFCFIKWEGKNYLAKITNEFTKKEMNGILLECYEGGEYKGGMWLAIKEKEGKDARLIQVSYDGEGEYTALAARMAEFAQNYHSGERVPAGTAEREDRQDGGKRICDIDNDGQEEEYYVSLWQTSNHYTTDCLSFESEDAGLDSCIKDMICFGQEPGVLRNMWMDQTEYGNVTYAVYEDGLYNFCVCGYLFAGESGKKLLQVDCDVRTEVMRKRVDMSGNICP